MENGVLSLRGPSIHVHPVIYPLNVHILHPYLFRVHARTPFRQRLSHKKVFHKDEKKNARKDENDLAENQKLGTYTTSM